MFPHYERYDRKASSPGRLNPCRRNRRSCADQTHGELEQAALDFGGEVVGGQAEGGFDPVAGGGGVALAGGAELFSGDGCVVADCWVGTDSAGASTAGVFAGISASAVQPPMIPTASAAQPANGKLKFERIMALASWLCCKAEDFCTA